MQNQQVLLNIDVQYLEINPKTFDCWAEMKGWYKYPNLKYVINILVLTYLETNHILLLGL